MNVVKNLLLQFLKKLLRVKEILILILAIVFTYQEIVQLSIDIWQHIAGIPA